MKIKEEVAFFFSPHGTWTTQANSRPSQNKHKNLRHLAQDERRTLATFLEVRDCACLATAQRRTNLPKPVRDMHKPVRISYDPSAEKNEQQKHEIYHVLLVSRVIQN
jgi:hypothetical protein